MAQAEMLEACPVWVACLVLVDQVDSLELVDSPVPVDQMPVTTMTAQRWRKLISCLVCNTHGVPYFLTVSGLD